MPDDSQVAWDDTTSPEELAELLAEGRDGGARELIASFIADVDGFARPVEKPVAIEVLRTLRRHNFFDELVEAAACVRRHGQEEPEVRRQLAQGLIEKGDVTAAIEERRASGGARGADRRARGHPRHRRGSAAAAASHRAQRGRRASGTRLQAALPRRPAHPG